MTDLALIWDVQSSGADLLVEGDDVSTDGGLETAVMLSLFLDRRADEGDALPSAESDRRGWWADALPVVENDRVGSRLWLLARSKQQVAVVDIATGYVREALGWLVEDKVCERFDVAVSLPASGTLGISVVVHRPKKDPVNFRFDYTWAAQAARRN